METEDLNKEVLSTLLNAIKTKKDSNHSDLLVRYKKGERGTDVYALDLETDDYRIEISLEFRKTLGWFGKKGAAITLSSDFKKRSYSSDNKIYDFGTGSSYDEDLNEIHSIVSESYKEVQREKEQEIDLAILDSLDDIVDDKFKREDKINDLLENA